MMEKTMRVRMLAAYGVLTLIAEIRDLLQQIDREGEE